MVYDRQYEDEILSFEPSGALKSAALVMRDRETDSWWSIMTASAIAGKRQGVPLHEIPVGRKTTWGAWRELHPASLVLSVGGRTHEPENAYLAYFDDPDRTYHDLVPDDDRLPSKTPIFAFRWNGEPVAVTHEQAEGGVVIRPGSSGPPVLIYRRAGAHVFESTRAFRVTAAMVESDDPEGVNRRVDAELANGAEGVEAIAGFDTYWYTWAMQNPGGALFR